MDDKLLGIQTGYQKRVQKAKPHFSEASLPIQTLLWRQVLRPFLQGDTTQGEFEQLIGIENEKMMVASRSANPELYITPAATPHSLVVSIRRYTDASNSLHRVNRHTRAVFLAQNEVFLRTKVPPLPPKPPACLDSFPPRVPGSRTGSVTSAPTHVQTT